MDYSGALEYLYSQLPMFQRIGAAAYKADLGNTIALTGMLGHPEKKFRSVHIAGTNGKGSVSHMLASVLQEAGYKTGLYTSPHLKDFRERIRINGKMVPKNYVTRFVKENKAAFEPVRPSFFEYTAVMAFEYFANEKVDIAVLETGMGGRLDSTNIITPVLSVITNISLDHTAFLGNTLAEIAREKAGIIKKDIPVVIGETQPDIAQVFLDISASQSAPIRFADQSFSAVKTARRRDDPGPDNWNIHHQGKIFLRGLKSPLKGNYQEKNLITLMGALENMRGLGLDISEKAIKDGVRKVIGNTMLLGRWQILGHRPKVICDVGHNEAGIRYILDQLAGEEYRYLHWVFGMVNDKETGKILDLLPKGAHYYFCRPDIPRGMGEKELQRMAEASGLSGKSYPSVKEAYHAARTSAHPDDLVFIGGSTFVVAEIL